MSTNSVRLSITIPKHVHDASRKEAAEYRLTLSAYIADILKQRHGIRSLPAMRQAAHTVSTSADNAPDSEAEHHYWCCKPCNVLNELDMALCHKCMRSRADVEDTTYKD